MEEYNGFTIETFILDDPNNKAVSISGYGIKDKVFGSFRLAKIFIDGFTEGTIYGINFKEKRK